MCTRPIRFSCSPSCVSSRQLSSWCLAWLSTQYSQRNKNSNGDLNMIGYFHAYRTTNELSDFKNVSEHESFIRIKNREKSVLDAVGSHDEDNSVATAVPGIAPTTTQPTCSGTRSAFVPSTVLVRVFMTGSASRTPLPSTCQTPSTSTTTRTQIKAFDQSSRPLMTSLRLAVYTIRVHGPMVAVTASSAVPSE